MYCPAKREVCFHEQLVRTSLSRVGGKKREGGDRLKTLRRPDVTSRDITLLYHRLLSLLWGKKVDSRSGKMLGPSLAASEPGLCEAEASVVAAVVAEHEGKGTAVLSRKARAGPLCQS